MSPHIVGIHPIDGNLRFLKRMIRLLENQPEIDFKYLRLSNNAISHSRCLAAITRASAEDTLLFLCHGRSTGILGCNFMGQFSTHHNCYEHGEFISSENITVLKDKKVFCIACDSNNIAKASIDAGARVFIGCNDIYFDRKDLMETDNCCRHVVDITKYVLRSCIFDSIVTAWKHNNSYSQWASYIKLLINKANDDLLLYDQRSYKREYFLRAANNLQLIKEGIRVWGNGDLRLFD